MDHEEAIPDFGGRYTDLTPISEREITSSFSAVDSLTGQPVFIKMLRASQTNNPTAIRFFHNEHALLRLLAVRAPEVPVVQVLETSQWNQQAYFTQPLLKGWSLDKAARSRSIFTGHNALRIIEGCLKFLELLHAADVAHGDISPDNIFIETDAPLSEDGEMPDEFSVRLVDFNSARRMSAPENLAAEPLVFIKVAYGAPEIARGEPLSARSDLYSLGAVLYQLLVGERPSTVRSMEMLARLTAPPRPIPLVFEVPPQVEALLRSLLSPSAGDRPRSAAECLRAIGDFKEVHRWLSRTSAPDVSAYRSGDEAQGNYPGWDPEITVQVSTDSFMVTGAAAPPPPVPVGAPWPSRVVTITERVVGAPPPPAPAHYDEVRSEISAIREGPVPSTEDQIDKVDFSVFAPWIVSGGSSFILEIWAYLREQRDEVVERATRHGRLFERGSRGPVRAERGTELTLVLRLDGFNVSDAHESFSWLGDVTNVPFIVEAPSELHPGVYPGQISILHNGMLLTRLVFDIEVGKTASEPGRLGLRREQIRTAFASYASSDREEVLRRVQGIAAAGVDVFLDVLSLRAGDTWEEQLIKNIREKDAFYLFWSIAASKSQWVEREWRYALSEKGIDSIHPIPLNDPRDAPPPPELANRHFNDLILACLKSTSIASGN